MGKMKELFVSGATDEEMNTMIDNARFQYNKGYIQFLESQLEKSEIEINNFKKLLKGTLDPRHCVECFKPLDFGEIICGRCQDELDGRWDHLRE